MALPTVTSGTVVAWYKSTSLSLADGAAVTTWADGSGNGYNLTGQASPVYVAGQLGGRPAVRLNGTSQFLWNDTAPTTAQPVTAFLVAKQNSTGATRSLFNANSTGPTCALFVDSSGVLSAYAGSVGAGPSITAGTGQIYETVFNGASSLLRLASGSGTAVSVGTDGMDGGVIVGANQDGSAEFFNGDIFEVIYYSGALSSTDRDAVRAYLQGEYFGSRSAVDLTDVGTGAVATTTAGATSVAPAYPSGVASGDIVYAYLHVRGAGRTVTTPANWQQVGSFASTSGASEGASTGNTKTWVYRRVAASSLTGTQSFTLSAQATTGVAQGYMRALRASGTNLAYEDDLTGWSNPASGTTTTTSPNGSVTVTAGKYAAKDVVQVSLGISNGSNTAASVGSVTCTGATFGSASAAGARTATTTGNDMATAGFTVAVPAGSNTGTPLSVPVTQAPASIMHGLVHRVRATADAADITTTAGVAAGAGSVPVTRSAAQLTASVAAANGAAVTAAGPSSANTIAVATASGGAPAAHLDVGAPPAAARATGLASVSSFIASSTLTPAPAASNGTAQGGTVDADSVATPGAGAGSGTATAGSTVNNAGAGAATNPSPAGAAGTADAASVGISMSATVTPSGAAAAGAAPFSGAGARVTATASSATGQAPGASSATAVIAPASVATATSGAPTPVVRVLVGSPTSSATGQALNAVGSSSSNAVAPASAAALTGSAGSAVAVSGSVTSAGSAAAHGDAPDPVVGVTVNPVPIVGDGSAGGPAAVAGTLVSATTAQAHVQAVDAARTALSTVDGTTASGIAGVPLSGTSGLVTAAPGSAVITANGASIDVVDGGPGPTQTALPGTAGASAGVGAVHWLVVLRPMSASAVGAAHPSVVSGLSPRTPLHAGVPRVTIGRGATVGVPVRRTSARTAGAPVIRTLVHAGSPHPSRPR